MSFPVTKVVRQVIRCEGASARRAASCKLASVPFVFEQEKMGQQDTKRTILI